MRLWRFLTPQALPWTLARLREFVVDWVRGAPPRTEQVAAFVAANARPGDPAHVLATMDRFAREERFLMNVGPDKGPLLYELLDALPRPARVLELGAFCGYSAILIADRLGPQGRLVSIEKSGTSARVSRANVAHAGLADRVEVIHGSSSEEISKLEGAFDLVFLDHWKDLYEKDLRLLESNGLLRPGTVVVADNVGQLFGAEAYLDYVRSCGRYDSENRLSTVEYSQMEDAVEISTYRGDERATPA